jgi:ketosteroid isomerase-like protein
VSPEHLEDIRRLYDAMNRRDIDGLRAFGQRYPGFSWQSAEDELSSPGTLDARDALSYSRELFELFEEMQTDILETIELDPDHVIFLVRHRVRGAAGGAPGERREAHLWSLGQDGALSLREFRTVEAARSAAAPA